MEARFKLRRSVERMVADGGISGLQMVVRTLGDDGRAASPPGSAGGAAGGGAGGGGAGPRYLLAPTHLSLALSQPPCSGMHIDLAITDIKITVSPGQSTTTEFHCVISALKMTIAKIFRHNKRSID